MEQLMLNASQWSVVDILRLLVVAAAVSWALPEVVCSVRGILEENASLVERGCHCPTVLFGLLVDESPECPVHGSLMSHSNHVSCDGDEYVVWPHASRVRVPVCRDCLKNVMQDKFDLYYHRRVVGTEDDTEWPKGCVLCEESTLCAMVPKNFVDDWLDGDVFHLSV